MSNFLHFTVSFPTDEGFFGRQCGNVECGRYFRIHEEDLQEQMFCPYCGEQFDKDQFYTKGQLEHANRVAKEKALKYAHDEMGKMLKRTFGGSSSNRFIKWEVKTTPYRERPVVPHYSEHKVDSALTCHQCGVRFQVDGIFGYCPKCRAEHLRIYDANLAIIRSECERAENGDRALRHAYSDFVSTFELLCKRRAKRCSSPKVNFQNLALAQQFFQKETGVDVLCELSPAESLSLRRVFQKRHLFTHGSQTIDERYVKAIPEDAAILNSTPTLSMTEFEEAATALRKVIDRVVQATEN